MTAMQIPPTTETGPVVRMVYFNGGSLGGYLKKVGLVEMFVGSLRRNGF
jgi:hypothetical protein